ncbi:MAG: hypothetical protein P8J45_10910 [Phycisphaerales bacterium]|nr:hypothetical protein [Phycisphaerales bacterium]
MSTLRNSIDGRHHAPRLPSPRRGNTLVLVTAILVLLVIIATAFISRTVGGRSVTAAQQRAFQREDHAQLAGEQVAAELAQALFTKPIDPYFMALADGYGEDGADAWVADGGLTGNLPASAWSGVPRSLPGDDIRQFDTPDQVFTAERFKPDVDFTFNFAPYEVRPFTNWPDVFVPDGAEIESTFVPYGPGALGGQRYDFESRPSGPDNNTDPYALGAGNPYGNPGYGDFRLLRDTEPRRLGRYYDGPLGVSNSFLEPNENPYAEYFSHWTHLSWVPTAENGWRVCYDISNVAPLDAALFNPDDPLVNKGPENGFTLSTYAFETETGVPYQDVEFPVALQTPYEQWYPNVEPWSVDPFYDGMNDLFFLNNDRGAGWFEARRNQWFNKPLYHFEAARSYQDVLPNFINLQLLGFAEQKMRRRWIEDNNGNALDIANELKALKREVENTFVDTDGDGFTDSFWFVPPTPVDRGVRQVVGISVIDNAGLLDANVATVFDRWSTSGATPSDLALVSRLGTHDGFDLDLDARDTHVGLFVDPKNSVEEAAFFPQINATDMGQKYRPERWFVREDQTPENRVPSFLNMRGIDGLLGEDGDPGPFYGQYRAVITQNADGTFTKDLPFYAEQERRLWNRAAQRGGEGLHVKDGDLVPFSTTPFAISDELELRSFAGQNHPYTYSRFERAVDDVVNVGHEDFSSIGANGHLSILRSSLERQETTPIQLYPDAGESGLGQPAVGRLSNEQLARDIRHRTTLLSGTRNEMRPVWLWPQSLAGRAEFDPNVDYDGDEILPGDDTDDGSESQQHYGEYERQKRKIDLRQSYAIPTNKVENPNFYPALPFTTPWFTNQSVWLNDLQKTLTRTFVWPDPETDLAWDEDLDLPKQSYFSSPWVDGDRFDTDALQAWQTSRLAAASLTANIEAFRDAPTQLYNFEGDTTEQDTILVDPPLHPFQARRVVENPLALPEDFTEFEEGFIGLEKQPFIMQAFMGLVYPKSRHPQGPDGQDSSGSGPIFGDPSAPNAWDAGYDIPEQFPNGAEPALIAAGLIGDQLNDEENRNYVDNSSEPAIVLAIQIGNPFNEPIPLADFCLRIGDYLPQNADNPEAYLWFADMACPHPIIDAGNPDEDPDARRSENGGYLPQDLMLGPTEPDAPRTAIVFAVIPPSGSNADPSSNWNLADFIGVSYEDFKQGWLDELDLQPGDLFGYESNMPIEYHQTLVLDASSLLHQELPPTNSARVDALFDNDNDRSIELVRQIADTRNIELPGDWTEDEVDNFRFVQVVVDRLDHDRGSITDPRSTDFNRTLAKLNPNAASLGTGEGSFIPPNVKDEVDDFENFRLSSDAIIDDPMRNGNNGTDTIEEDDDNRWAGIHIGSDDFFMAWARVSRMWGWDSDASGMYDMDEISPRYAFSVTSRPVASLPDRRYSVDFTDWNTNRDVRLRVPGVNKNFVAFDGNEYSDFGVPYAGEPGLAEPGPRDDTEGFRGDTFDVASFNLTDEDDEPGMMGYIERVLPIAPLNDRRGPNTIWSWQDDENYEDDVWWGGDQPLTEPLENRESRPAPWWIYAKPTNFPTWTVVNGNIDGNNLDTKRALYERGFPIFVGPDSGDYEAAARAYYQQARASDIYDSQENVVIDVVPMDLGATRQEDFFEGFREPLWAGPLQMLLKDRDFEQIGELNNVFVWGPVLALPDMPDPNDLSDPDWELWKDLPLTLGAYDDGVAGTDQFAVKRTFAEVMTEIAVHQDPFRANELNMTEGPGFKFRNGDPDEYPVGFGPLINRIDIDLGFRGGDPSMYDRPWRQVLGGGLNPFAQTYFPAYQPQLPAGAGIFDAVTIDGRGLNAAHPDFDGDGVFTLEESLRAELDRFDLARGFSKKPTRGLVNVNTASVEVLRTLPQMSRLIYNDYFEDPDFSNYSGQVVRSAIGVPAGEDRHGANTEDSDDIRNRLSNHKHVRFAEQLDRYRLGDDMEREARDFLVQANDVDPDPEETWIVLPSMVDRGNLGREWAETAGTDDYVMNDHYGAFYGMRTDRGIVSLGELLTMQRTAFEEFLLTDYEEDAPQFGNSDRWVYRNSNIRMMAENPYKDAGFGWDTGSGDIPYVRNRFFLGYRDVANRELPYPPSGKIFAGQGDARVSTDRNTRRRTLLGRRTDVPNGESEVGLPAGISKVEFAPDMVSGDAEEMNLLFSGMANMITTRSDVFTVYMTIRTFKQDPATGIWDASKPANIIDESRYMMVVDRSEVEAPTDKPRILAFSKVE